MALAGLLRRDYAFAAATNARIAALMCAGSVGHRRTTFATSGDDKQDDKTRFSESLTACCDEGLEDSVVGF